MGFGQEETFVVVVSKKISASVDITVWPATYSLCEFAYENCGDTTGPVADAEGASCEWAFFSKGTYSRSPHRQIFWELEGSVVTCKIFVFLSDEGIFCQLLLNNLLRFPILLGLVIFLCCGCSRDNLVLLWAFCITTFVRVDAVINVQIMVL